MLEKSSLRKRCVILLLLVFGLLLGAAWAQTEHVLYSFCAQTNCADGAESLGGVVFDQKGNLYGTTLLGGADDHCGKFYDQGCGVVFKLAPGGRETILYSFCAQGGDYCTDGASPLAGLAFDQKGNLYGTAGGGTDDNGVVFKLTPEGKYTVFYRFCAQTDCTDGSNPWAGVVFDQKGNLYGTTSIGGAYGVGVVFKLTPKGKETVLYSFCAQGGRYCSNGAGPRAGVVFDQKGNLYGTTFQGGAGFGVVFKLTPKGKYTVLHTFCAQNGCSDGAYPDAGLVLDQSGSLYGTTPDGGAYGSGTVFKLTPQGKETVLYSFCTQSGCADGWLPHAGVVLDQKGDLYGTTSSGGVHDGGLIFKLTAKGKYTVLHRFCAQNGCIDGAYPYAGVVFDRSANLYGTTSRGGAYGGGGVFKLTP